MTHYRATCRVTVGIKSEWLRADSAVAGVNAISESVQREVAAKLGVDPEYVGVSVGALEDWTTYCEDNARRREKAKPKRRRSCT